MNRKLIRPNLSEFKEKSSREQPKKKPHPAFETFAENYYYLKQMNKKIPMVVALTDGEVVDGLVEWYDRDCIKLNRTDAPNLLIYKHSIKYLYKVEEASQAKAPNRKRPPQAT